MSRRDESVRGRRRWPWLVAGCVTVGLLIAAYFPLVYFPNWRPTPRAGEQLAIDVSHYQFDIDWRAVADDGVDVAYIKATEGGDWVDDYFARNWDRSGAAGIRRGAYHFFTFCRSGAEQAANFLRTVPDDPAALPPMVDLEYNGNCSDRPEPVEFRKQLEEFIRIVEDARGARVLIYVMPDFDRNYGVLEHFDGPTAQRKIWYRPTNDRWLLWQATSWGNIDGIDGPVDIDIWRGD